MSALTAAAHSRASLHAINISKNVGLPLLQLEQRRGYAAKPKKAQKRVGGTKVGGQCLLSGVGSVPDIIWSAIFMIFNLLHSPGLPWFKEGRQRRPTAPIKTGEEHRGAFDCLRVRLSIHFASCT